MLLNMQKMLDVDADYVSSWDGMMSIALLASGGGVFGIIARQGLRNDSATIEFLFWVAIFAWVTNLLGFLYSSYNKNKMSTCGLVQHWVTITILYVLATVLFGVYDTFGTPAKIPRFVFALAVFTTVGYLEKAICQIIQLVRVGKEGCGKTSKVNEVENGNGDQVPLDEIKTKDETS